MSADISKLLTMASMQESLVGRIYTLGVEYEAKTITAERFALRVCEMISENNQKMAELAGSLTESETTEDGETVKV